MSVKEFHSKRRMFCIHNGRIFIGPLNSPLSHLQWFESLGYDGPKMIDDSVRGFADERGIFFYKGEDFEIDDETEKAFFKHLAEIQAKLNLPPTTQVYGGVTPVKDTRYPPKKKYGTIAENTR